MHFQFSSFIHNFNKDEFLFYQLFSQFACQADQTMRHALIDKQQRKPASYIRQKMISQQPNKKLKQKNKQQKQELARISKKISSKPSSRQNQQSFKNSLFNSIQELPLNRIETKPKQNKKSKKADVVQTISSYTKIEDTTTSRQAKIKTKQYDHPNGQYFGSRNIDHSRSKSKSKKNKLQDISLEKISRSLEHKMREFRSIESLHESQSESLKSEISDQEMRRLKKMHSMEKMRLLEEIIGMEQKIIKKRHRY